MNADSHQDLCTQIRCALALADAYRLLEVGIALNEALVHLDGVGVGPIATRFEDQASGIIFAMSRYAKPTARSA